MISILFIKYTKYENSKTGEESIIALKSPLFIDHEPTKKS